MNGLKWFEKKWFVNLKTRTRLTMCFLFMVLIPLLLSVAGIIIVFSARLPNAILLSVIIGAAFVLEIVLAFALGGINAFLITDPMGKNERVLVKYAVGDLDTSNLIRERDWHTVKYQDEIGIFSSKLKDLMQYMKALNACIKQVSEGDLTVSVPVACPQDQIGNALHQLVDNFHNVVATMVNAIEQVTSGAKLVSDSSFSLSQGATQQASAIQELTASLEQISSQTHLNAKNAEEANEFAKNAKSNASRGNAQMKDMLKAMDDISVSSGNINKIIKVIDDIAFQTNILALNAAVEAARAGQHGKGFAVVAEEVRNLAGKSANAAKETTEMIENSIRKVEIGTKIANETAKALDEIVYQVDRAADLINSIAVASVEQAQGIEQINIGISQVSQVVQTNAATAQESAAASEELSSQASRLKDSAARFKLNGKSAATAPAPAPAPAPSPVLRETPKPPASAPSPSALSGSKPKILLADNEFGKY